MSDTPELDKIMKVKRDADAISMFMDELYELGLVLCDTETLEDAPDNSGYYPTTRSMEDILYQHFEIDPVKADQERRMILEEARQLRRTTQQGETSK